MNSVTKRGFPTTTTSKIYPTSNYVKSPSYIINREREDDITYKCREIDNKIRHLNAKIYKFTNHINSMSSFEYEEMEEYVKKVKALEERKKKMKKYITSIHAFDDINYDDDREYYGYDY